MDKLSLSSPGSLLTLSLTAKGSWLPWGRVVMPLVSPSKPSRFPEYVGKTFCIFYCINKIAF